MPPGRWRRGGRTAKRRIMHSQSTERQWLTLEGLLKRLPLKRSRVYYLVHTDQIPHHRIGRTLIFDYDEIVRWVERDGELGISRKAS
jgi:excisionase family DNA binding protein